MDVMIALGAACLLIRMGQALYGMGLIRAKNAAGATLRSVCEVSAAMLAFWLVGAAIFRWDRYSVGFGAGVDGTLFFLGAVMLIGGAIPGAAMAERSRFWPLGWAAALMGGIIVPLGARWSWQGWLARMHFIDAAGATWLHAAGAVCGLAGAIAVGPRTGKYHRDGSASMIPGHNIPQAGIGLFAMLAGWAPYVAGCLMAAGAMREAGQAAACTLVAGCAGGMAAILLGRYRYGKPDVVLTVMGFVGGLVAISAGAGKIQPAGALLIGAGAGLLVPMCAVWLDLLAHIDDPVGVVAVHGVGGVWGTVMTGLFIPGSFGHRVHQMGIQAVGVVSVLVMAAVLSAAVFALLRVTVRLRATEADEFDGLDLAEHDIGAYPDFQQTTIKSYHLREA
jgi:ammonium transporter, Amt family